MSAQESRLLRQLNGRIASAPTQLALDCLLAERACYWARQGLLLETEKTIGTLRIRYDREPIDVIAVRINLAEGFLHHFRDMNALAREKIHRAYALSEISGDSGLISLTAAWLGHMDYLRGDVPLMSKHLARALSQAEPSNHAALSRAALVAADALHLAGRLDLAQPWYQVARVHANAEGDDATTSAFMHNMAWLRAANLRQVVLRGQGHVRSSEHALMSTDSVQRYDEIVGTSSLKSLLPILRAQVLSLLGDYAEALHLYEGHLEAARHEGMERMHCALLADQAWCRLSLADPPGALRDANLAESLVCPTTHHDDKAATHSRLAQVYGALGDEARKAMHSDFAEKSWGDHRAMQQSIVDQVGRLQLGSMPSGGSRVASG